MNTLEGIFPANKLFLAPMAGITDLPFRLLTRRYGCQFAFTEMVNATGLSRGVKRSELYLTSHPCDKPLGVQLFGANPQTLAQAARIAECGGAAHIDINCGCPVRKVARVGAGAALMKSPQLIGEIIATVKAAISIPISVKIRTGWDLQDNNAVAVARIAQAAGANLIFVHPRTAKQGFSGSADWRVIKEVKDAVGIPVIGNGDVRNLDDAKRMFAETGCAGVMIGRAAWGAPWLFSEMAGNPPPSAKQKAETIIEHLALSCAHYGITTGVKIFRVHLLAYIRGKHGSSAFRRHISTIIDKEELVAEIKNFWGEE